ncbi:hypothetical protein QTP88_009574 [Uroleucon formosanum]
MEILQSSCCYNIIWPIFVSSFNASTTKAVVCIYTKFVFRCQYEFGKLFLILIKKNLDNKAQCEYGRYEYKVNLTFVSYCDILDNM